MPDGDVLGNAFRLVFQARPSSLALVVGYAGTCAAYESLAGGSGAEAGVYLGLTMVVEAMVIYRLVLDMTGLRGSIEACGRYLAGTALATAPLIVMLAAIWLLPMRLQDGAAVTTLTVTATIGFAIAMLLQAWPVAMIATGRWLSPGRMIRATRGHRWHLAVLLVIVGVLAGASGIDPTQSAGAAMTFGLLRTGLLAFQAVLMAGVASAAYRAALANDPGLRREPHLD